MFEERGGGVFEEEGMFEERKGGGGVFGEAWVILGEYCSS